MPLTLTIGDRVVFISAPGNGVPINLGVVVADKTVDVEASVAFPLSNGSPAFNGPIPSAVLLKVLAASTPPWPDADGQPVRPGDTVKCFSAPGQLQATPYLVEAILRGENDSGDIFLIAILLPPNGTPSAGVRYFTQLSACVKQKTNIQTNV